MNSLEYIAVYLVLGLIAGMTHLVFDGRLAIGASGALCGVMGLYFAIYPKNEISCFWFFFLRAGSFDLSGWVLIAIWFVGDLFGAFSGPAGIAYWAHVGGTLAGLLFGMLLLKLGRIDLADYDRPTLLGLMQGERD
jgi:membrane associated rhomboid family serine protease